MWSGFFRIDSDDLNKMKKMVQNKIIVHTMMMNWFLSSESFQFALLNHIKLSIAWMVWEAIEGLMCSVYHWHDIHTGILKWLDTTKWLWRDFCMKFSGALVICLPSHIHDELSSITFLEVCYQSDHQAQCGLNPLGAEFFNENLERSKGFFSLKSS